MSYSYIPQAERKKILLISDDLRFPSGVGVMSRELVVGSAHRYNWVQLAAAVQHPEQGKVLDASESLNSETNLTDSYLHIYPHTGYGDAATVRKIIAQEKPDAIMIFTDPRYFVWLFNMEHEIRQTMPIIYYNIWDSTPAPMYNKSYYRSCDALLSISKQTYAINRKVLGDSVTIIEPQEVEAYA